MARKLRIQYEGALYHVINRGNYRRDVFESAGAAQAFETTLFEACDEHEWRLHAHVVMRNHYHLVVETPRANLVQGMHWLQSTFATRFNRFRQERGHLFQGRYQALLIENMAAMANVVDYIHLNPIRAGVVPVDLLDNFRWSSLPKFKEVERPKALICKEWLEQRGHSDSPTGLSDYVGYLKELAGDQAEQQRLGFETLSSGWAIGSEAWRKAVAKDHQLLALDPGLDGMELRELRLTGWQHTLAESLRETDKNMDNLAKDVGSSSWKIQIAIKLRKVGAPYAWIAERLHMGKPSSVRAYVSEIPWGSTLENCHHTVSLMAPSNGKTDPG